MQMDKYRWRGKAELSEPMIPDGKIHTHSPYSYIYTHFNRAGH